MMPRNRLFGIYVLLGVVALGAGMLVAQFFGTSASLPSGYATPEPLAQSTAPVAPTAVAAPTQVVAPSPTAIVAEAPTEAPTAAPEPTPTPEAPATALPEPTQGPAEASATADPGYIEYTVQRGDILKDIAERYGVTIGEIIAINDIPNPDSLVVASVIRIPKK